MGNPATKRLRRDAEDAIIGNIRVGLPKAHVDAASLLNLCDRCDALMDENARLRDAITQHRAAIELSSRRRPSDADVELWVALEDE